MSRLSLIAIAACALSLSACANAPKSPAGIEVRVQTTATGLNAGRGPDSQFEATLSGAPRAARNRANIESTTRRELGETVALEPLSEQVTVRVRFIIEGLANTPEQAVWIDCEKANGIVVVTGDDTYYDIWISVGGGSETHYRRAGMLNGRVGKIAALVMDGREPADTDCIPRKQ